jgi:hypothetical protein
MKLTEKEFDTIIEALEKLPRESMDGKLFTRMMCSIITKGDEAKAQEMEDSLAVKELEEEVQRKAIKKRCGIIAGKLYMMKDEIVECEL